MAVTMEEALWAATQLLHQYADEHPEHPYISITDDKEVSAIQAEMMLGDLTECIFYRTRLQP